MDERANETEIGKEKPDEIDCRAFKPAFYSSIFYGTEEHSVLFFFGFDRTLFVEFHARQTIPLTAAVFFEFVQGNQRIFQMENVFGKQKRIFLANQTAFF